MKSQPVLKRSLSDDVKRLLKDHIYSMDLNRSDKLPPEAVVAEKYSVSRVTIRRVMDELEGEGLIIRIHGRGTFVNKAAMQIDVNLMQRLEYGKIVKQSGYKAEVRLLRCELETPNEVVVRDLRTKPDEKLITVEKLYLADGHPSILCIDRIPKKYLNTMPAKQAWETQSVFEVLRECGTSIIQRDRLEMEAVTKAGMEKETPNIRLMENDALLRFFGINYDQNNIAVNHGTVFYDTRYIRYSILRNIDPY